METNNWWGDRARLTPERIMECAVMTAVAIIVAFTIVLGLGYSAFGQERHQLGHSEYLSWSSKKTGNCCSNMDCRFLDDNEVRDTDGKREIQIAGQWCPVLPEHYIIRGKSPDWTHYHACIGHGQYWEDHPPCERLLCFSDKGGF